MRDVKFHKGLNLIVDDTPEDDTTTGNNVGKTTVLKLVDYCLGGSASDLYSDPENKKRPYQLVKDYLEQKQVRVRLELVRSLSDKVPERVVIERNFLGRSSAVRTINGERITDKEFETRLGELLIPELPEDGKPTFRQVISHNIRYKDDSLTHTLKTLNRFTKNVEYEALYLFLLGCPVYDAASKQHLSAKKKNEVDFLKRLSSGRSKTDYEIALDLLNNDLAVLDAQRKQLGADPDFEHKLQESNRIKTLISRASSKLSQVEVRESVIKEACEELDNNVSTIDLDELGTIYREANALIPDIQKSFDDLVRYHNAMLKERKSFITKELPELEARRARVQTELTTLLDQDNALSSELSTKLTSEEFDRLVAQINENYRQKGEYESMLQQLNASEKKIAEFDKQLSAISDDIESEEYETRVREQRTKFNAFFSSVSERLYGEKYALASEVKTDPSGTRYYDFHTLDARNVSDGKKQGEILCFDLAYTMFADSEGISCLHFLLNDKKELLHDHQLLAAAKLADEHNIQLVISILRDKLPAAVDNEQNIVLRLSQNDKFFRIEQNL
nr:DUF2326 domain-containing protein [Bifidobacterium tibiigranuli]